MGDARRAKDGADRNVQAEHEDKRQMRHLLIGVFGLIFAGTITALAAGFAGRLHPIGDSLAVFRLQIGILATLSGGGLALLVRHRWLWLFTAGATVVVAATTSSYLPGASAATNRAGTIYQKNLLFRLEDPAPLIADILASEADVVTFQEVSARNQAVLEALADAYPFQAYCQFGTVGGTAVLSRWPSVGNPVCDGGLTGLNVRSPEGPLWIVSLHLHWPWPYGQAGHVDQLVPMLEELDGTIVVGGDFNMVPWASSVARIERATRTNKAGPTVTTLSLKRGLVPLPIDHVLLPHGWQSDQTVRPQLGSDHKGIVVTFTGR